MDLACDLCSKCRSLNISKDTFSSSPFEERRAHQLGQFYEAAQRACNLCQLITNAYSEGPVASKDLQSCHLQACWQQIYPDLPTACLAVWIVPSGEKAQTQLSIHLIDDNETPGSGRLDKGQGIDFERVKDWLCRCEKLHTCMTDSIAARSANSMPTGFMIIDVQANCLVKPIGNCRFFALSYVWGGAKVFKTVVNNVKELSQVGAFEDIWDELPPIIRDAIEFTRKMSERYLWVDSLCIEQDNVFDLVSNINAMDTIYRQAVLVIWAANDAAPAEGLHGITLKPRDIRQTHAELGPGLTLLARFHHGSYLELTKYRDRGWTFQEEQLSTRAAVFVNGQIYFVCSSHVYSEDIHEHPEDKPNRQLIFNHKLSRFIQNGISPSVAYLAAVREYTSRHLTYQSDILNAFRGAEVILASQLSSKLLFALPTCLFDAILLWQPLEKVERRLGFPSWCWAGWKGPVGWRGDTLELASPVTITDDETINRKLTGWLRNHTWITWYHFTHEKGITPVWEPGDGSTVGYDSTATTANNIYGRASIPRGLVTTHQSQRHTEFTLEHRLHALPANLRPLIFRTLCAAYNIRPSSAYLQYGSSVSAWNAKGRQIFLIMNRNDQTSGYVLLDETWASQPMDKPYTFLLLSEANYWCDWRRPHEDHPYTKYFDMECYEEYHIMMVTESEVAPDFTIYERAGIGRLHKEAVSDAHGESLEWREVVLV